VRKFCAVATVDRAPQIRNPPLPAKHATEDFSQDRQLLEAARSGDRAPFGELPERYGQMVRGVLPAHLPCAEIADLVQDVFLIG